MKILLIFKTKDHKKNIVVDNSFARFFISKLCLNCRVWTFGSPYKPYSAFTKEDIEKILNSTIVKNNNKSWEKFIGLLFPKIIEYFPDMPLSKLGGIKVS